MKNLFKNVAEAVAQNCERVYCSDIYEAKMIKDMIG